MGGNLIYGQNFFSQQIIIFFHKDIDDNDDDDDYEDMNDMIFQDELFNFEQK